MSFSKQFSAVAGAELAGLGLLRAVPFEHPDYAVYFRRENSCVGSYVFVRDARAQGSGVRCDYWFAALDLPDDRIKAANAGVRIAIYDAWAFDDDIAKGIVRRIGSLSRLRDAMIDAVQHELLSPIFATKRCLMLLSCVRIVRRLQESHDGKIAWERVMMMVRERGLSVFASAPDLNELDSELRKAINNLTNLVAVVDSDAKGMKDSVLSSLLYERALLLLS